MHNWLVNITLLHLSAARVKAPDRLLRRSFRLLVLASAIEWGVGDLECQGIPEPDLVMYGVVRDVSGEESVRVTAGELAWTFQPSGGGPSIEVGAALQNINDQFSYILRVPCETGLTGIPSSPDALRLGSSYDRSQVTVAGVEAAFSQVSQQMLGLAATDRGRIERVDLMVSLGQSGSLPEAWQQQYFGRVGIDPFDDPDEDGVNNLNEYRAGTHPLDPESLFQVNVTEAAEGGPRLEWQSAPGRAYTIQRSTDLTTGFEVLAAGLPATPPTNVYRDEPAGGQTYFYRVLVDPEGP
jgi:hypothetical protein